MTAELTPSAGAALPPPTSPPPPRRARQLIPAALPRRGELVAACAVALVLAHLLLAQLTLVLAVLFALLGRATRWRPWWLLGPAAAGLAWALAIGPDRALAGLAAAPACILAHLGAWRPAARGGPPSGGHLGLAGLLARQLPAALPLGAAEAALYFWLAWLHTDEWAIPPPRPGAVAALRAAATARAVHRGAVVTRDGCALGVDAATGAVAELRWTEIACGALVAGSDERDVTLAGLQVVHAALRRRKSLIVLADQRDRAVAGALAAACVATGTPMLPAEPGDGRAAPPERTPAAAGRASGLWGRGEPEPRDRRAADDAGGAGAIGPADLTPVISGRAAVLLDAGTPPRAARACAAVAALAAHLRAIGVDGDALVWAPRAELLPGPALAALLRDGGPGLAVLAGTTSAAAATGVGDLAGAILIRRVTEPGLAGALAARSGTRLLPPPVAAAQAGQVPTATLAGAARGGQADLVPGPVIAARSLLALGQGEFVLAVRSPRPRQVAPGRLVPARLPSGAGGSATGPAS